MEFLGAAHRHICRKKQPNKIIQVQRTVKIFSQISNQISHCAEPFGLLNNSFYKYPAALPLKNLYKKTANRNIFRCSAPDYYYNNNTLIHHKLIFK